MNYLIGGVAGVSDRARCLARHFTQPALTSARTPNTPRRSANPISAAIDITAIESASCPMIGCGTWIA